MSTGWQGSEVVRFGLRREAECEDECVTSQYARNSHLRYCPAVQVPLAVERGVQTWAAIQLVESTAYPKS